MECAIDSLVQPKKLQCFHLPRATPTINMDFFKPPELGLIPLPHSPIPDLPYDLWPEDMVFVVPPKLEFSS